MDRVNEIIGHLTDEEYDAVLYGVMLRLLERKEKQFSIDEDCELILIGIDKENEHINIFNQDGCYDDPPILIDEVNINEA